MRAYDIALILALFGAVMGILDTSAVWAGGTIDTGPDVINQSVFDDIKVIEDPSDLAIATDMLTYGWTAIIMFFGVLMRIIYIQDIIADGFGGSPEAEMVAWTVQAGILLTYAVALVQLKTGKNIKGME